MKTGALVLALMTLSVGAAAQEADVAGLKAAAKKDATDPAASLALGRALRRAGRFDEAVTELNRGAALGAATKSGYADSIRYELLRVRVEQRKLGPALIVCKGLSGHGLAAACRADAYLMQNRASEALPEVDKALGQNAQLYEAKVAQGRALALQGKTAEAEAALREAAGGSGPCAGKCLRSEAPHHLGLLLLNAGKRDAGIAELRKARSADAGDPWIALSLGEALGPTKEAHEALEAAVKIRPGFAAAWAALARTALDLGDVAAAEAAATQAVKLDGALYQAHVSLGKVWVAKQKWDDAMKEGETAKKLIPNSAQGELLIADAHAGKGDIDLAVESYQRSYGLDRQNPDPLVRAARACTAAGRLTTAKGFADRATFDFPKHAPGWVELGDVSVKLGDKGKAKTAYQTALKSEGLIDKAAVQKKLSAL